MDSLPAVFLTSFLVALSGAMMPGPVLAVTIAEAARKKRFAGLFITAGHAVVEVILIALILVGLGGFLTRPDSVRIMGLAGGSALILMGAATFAGARKADYSSGTELKTGRGPVALMFLGAFTSVTNPYWMLWWATVGLGYLSFAGRLGRAGIISFYTGHILADGAWLGLVSFLVASGRWGGGRGIKALLAACGVFLVLLGGYFITQGLGISLV